MRRSPVIPLLCLLLAGAGWNCKEQEQEIPVTAVTVLRPASTVLAIGESVQLSATVQPENATDKTLTWATSAPKVASVTGEGLVTALAEGSAAITARAGGKSGTCVFTVQKPAVPVSAIELDKTSLQLYEGTEVTLKATVLPQDATDPSVTWRSADETIASVDENGTVHALKAGETRIVAQAGAKQAECAVKVLARTIPVSAIVLNKTSLPDMVMGETAQLTATVQPENASHPEVSWSSTNAEIASVDQKGLVRALKEGSARIVAYADGVEATCDVTMHAIRVESLTLNRDSLKLYEGENFTLKATLSPSNATYPEISWHSADSLTASVQGGKVTALRRGKTVVSATADGLQASCSVEVLAAIEGIELDQTELNLMEGDRVQLTARIVPEEAVLREPLRWASSDESIAQVDSSGRVSALHFGDAVISVSAEGKKAECQVHIDYIHVASITLEPTDIVMMVGDTLTLKATLTPDNASFSALSWSSSRPEVASVDKKGKVTALEDGLATITASADGQQAQCWIRVNLPPSLYINCTTGEATDVTGNSACLWADVDIQNAQGDVATVDVYYSDKYADPEALRSKGTKVTAGTLPAGGGRISATANGLQAGTTYSFIAVASIDGSEGYGSVCTFTTPDGKLCTDIGQTPIVLAYYTEYSDALPDVSLLTHINYAHGRFHNPSTGDGGIDVTSPEKLKKIVALKSQNPNLKVMLMIGGWGEKADGFSMMARSATKRTAFCQSVKQIIETYKLDGVDIDWEYPTYPAEGNGADPSDTQNFNLVLKELRQTIGSSKIISYASSANAKYVDWKTAIQYIDYVNVMTYDMGSAPDGHNSPLYRSNKFDHRSCDESIGLHKSAGIPLDRLVLGIPFYGKSEKNPSTQIFEYSVKYREIPDILEKGMYKGKKMSVTVTRKWEPTSKVPYLVDSNGKNVLSYDDPESVDLKGKYVLSKGLLGAMFWEYRHDTDKQTLLKALVNAIYGQESVLN